MVKTIDENELENKLIKELIAMPGADFNKAPEIIKRKRAQHFVAVFVADDIAGMDTPEG